MQELRISFWQKGQESYALPMTEWRDISRPGKIIKTGNPVRQDFKNINALKGEALSFFGLNERIPVILVIGGSLGAHTIK